MPSQPSTPVRDEAGGVAAALPRLAALHDPRSRDRFLTLTADLSDRHHARELERRAGEVRAALGKGPDREAFDAAWTAGERELRRAAAKPGTRAVAVFAAPEHGLLEAFALGAAVPTSLVLDSSPYVRPLARFADEWEPFALVLLDGERAAIYHVAEARAEAAARERTRLIGRHKKGGMSQMRYQRHRQGALDRFYDEVAARLGDLMRAEGVRRVVLAGPGQAKRAFHNRLTPSMQAAVMAVEDADFDERSDDALVRRYAELVKAEEAKDSALAVQALRVALRKGELALTGPFETARAARDGRIEVLLVRKDHRAGGRKCEAHQTLFEDAAACPVCSGQGTQVDVLNEAVEYALRAGSRVEFAADPEGFLAGVGGAGALLRW